MNVGFVSLGCSKNLVDTEMMIGLFKNNEYSIVNDEKEAEIIVVNTCGFIESAKQEAINTILEMAEYKTTGKCKYLIVTGCLVQRYKKELEESMPEVDLFISIDQYEHLWDKISELIKEKPVRSKNTMDYMERIVTTGDKMAYLKIAEGCSNRCTYCAIPYIRGPYISRKMEDIIEEAKQLAHRGIKEIIVIAQDTTKYGIDIYGKARLAELLEELCKIDEIEWIRFLYAYPESITEELIQTVKNNPKICKYFDIPIQHISNPILKKMNRHSNKDTIINIIKKIREEIPEVILRTSLIVGFPTETEEDFKELEKFVQETEFDKLGVFMYSKEDGTPAEKLKEQVHHNTKRKRWNKIMKKQQEISKKKLAEKIGKEYEMITENRTADNKYIIGRTQMDVPDMDGIVYLKNDGKIKIGQFIKCKIVDVKEYDLIAEAKTKKSM